MYGFSAVLNINTTTQKTHLMQKQRRMPEHSPWKVFVGMVIFLSSFLFPNPKYVGNVLYYPLQVSYQ